MTRRRPLTEDEWLSSDAPGPMLHYLQQHRLVTKAPGGRRKLRLFCVACCRAVWDHMDGRSRSVVEVSERFADGDARKTELAAAREVAERAYHAVNEELHTLARTAPYRSHESLQDLQMRQSVTSAAWLTAWLVNAAQAAQTVALSTQIIRRSLAPGGAAGPEAGTALDKEASFQADLVRCIFGNPFRPVAVDASWNLWNGGTVVRLARMIYDDRAFDRMPVLADALEEAGRDEQAILSHCRSVASHARGCWIVDALLGRGVVPDV